MMKNFLTETITYTSKLSSHEIINRLNLSKQYEKTGKGYRENTFNIRPIVDYRNSFLPNIHGNISENQKETIINVTMKIHSLVLAFIIFWLGGVFLGCIATAYVMIKHEFDYFLLIPFAMLFFGTILPYYAFKSESKKSIKNLQEIFEADIFDNKKER